MTTLDETIANLTPFAHPPRRRNTKKIDKFVSSIGFDCGKLYSTVRPWPWIYGPIDDPEWFGDRDKQGNYVINSEPDDVVVYLGFLIINWVDSISKRKYWYPFFKFIVEDKIAYFPVPVDIAGTELENEFRKIFKEVGNKS